LKERPETAEERERQNIFEERKRERGGERV
jgi:hypothetical protein